MVNIRGLNPLGAVAIIDQGEPSSKVNSTWPVLGEIDDRGSSIRILSPWWDIFDRRDSRFDRYATLLGAGRIAVGLCAGQLWNVLASSVAT